MTWTPPAQNDPWRCGGTGHPAGCGTHHPIQPLARACEARHDLESRQGCEDQPDTGENTR